MLTLYDYGPSQNCYKVRLLLNQLGRAYRTHKVSIFEGDGRTPEFLKINPMGAVPAIRLDDGRCIAESNAILCYLAEGSPFLPADPFVRAKVLQWMFFERSYVSPSIATLRYWTLTGKLDRQKDLAWRFDLGHRSLEALDCELSAEAFIAGSAYTIADMSLFAYVHLSEDARISLESYANVRAWIARVRAQPRFLAEVHAYAEDPHSNRDLP